MMSNLNHNPWRGLAAYAYQDPGNSEENYKFCGRQVETDVLVKLIEYNLFVTLYGRTGIGKTSLLQAGASPILREHNFVPIFIRLSRDTPDNKSYAEAIIEKIEHSELVCDRRQVKTLNTSSDYILWDYFCTTSFKSKDGVEVYPVVVLDQFEEIFFTHKQEAKTLLRQIYYLIDDTSPIIHGEGYSDDTNYRFLASIREDNLYLLEDCIDELSLNLYKSNRFRLRPLSPENARDAILIPGEKCITEGEKDEIASQIIEASKEEDGSISTLILSLLCYIAFEAAKKQNFDDPLITSAHIPDSEDSTDDILSAFYLNNTTKKQRKIIERELLTSDGHRKAEVVEIPNIDKLLQGNTRILQNISTESGDKVEITHDRLARVIYKQKRYRDNNRFRNLARALIIFLSLIAVYLGCMLQWSTINLNNGLGRYVGDINNNLKTREIHINDSIARKLIYYCDSTKTLYLSDFLSVFIGDKVNNIDSIHPNLLPYRSSFCISPNNKRYSWKYAIDAGRKYQMRRKFGVLFDNETNTVLYHQSTSKYTDTKTDTTCFRDGRLKSEFSFVPTSVPNYVLIVNPSVQNDTLGEYKQPNFGKSNVVIHSNREQTKWIYDPYVERVTFASDFKYANSIEFYCCEKLKEVIFLADSLDCSSIVFDCCPNLNPKTIKLPKWLSNKPDTTKLSGFNVGTVSLEDTVFFKKRRYKNCAYEVLYYPFKDDTKYKDKYHKKITILDNNNDSCMFLPPSESGGEFYFTHNSTLNLKEIHIPFANLYHCNLFFDDLVNKKDITLFVPYGCLYLYDSDSSFDEFKAIKEDSFFRRLCDSLYYQFSAGFFWLAKPHIVLLVIVGLLLLSYLLHRTRIKLIRQNKKGKVKFSAFQTGIGVGIGIICYFAVYWLVFNTLWNHYEFFKERYYLTMGVSVACGCLSAIGGAYLFLFAANGQIFNFKKRSKKQKS